MLKPVARKRWKFALGVLLLVAAVAAIFWPSEKQSIGHTVRYSDGTTLTLKEVTYGTEHRYLGGGFRERILSLLPRKLATKYASRSGILSMGQPSVTFWFERRGKPPTTCDLVLCDASGFGMHGGTTMMMLSPPNNSIEGWSFEAWPRRERTFTVRVYERDKQYRDAALIGEFTVRNPKPGNFPVWTASPLPITANDGDLSVVLFELTSGVGEGFRTRRPAPNPLISQTQARFRVERNNMPTIEWGIATVEASDATGNVIRDIWGAWRESDVEFVGLRPHLWPSESAWKLRVGFSQRSNFVTSEVWTLRDVRLLGFGNASGPGAQTNLQGALLQFTGQSRASALGGNHHFNFRVTPARPDYRITLVKAVDDKGNEPAVANTSESWSERTFALNVNTNATSIDLTVALHRTRYFDFLARPAVISTNRANPP